MLSEINLILQIGILVALIVGVVLVKRLKFNLHGYIMFSVVALNFLSIILVMLPAAVRILSGASPNIFKYIVAAHSVLGIIVEGLGIYVVGIWRFRRPGGTCFKLKNHMLVLSFLWMLSMILGVMIYLVLYA